MQLCPCEAAAGEQALASIRHLQTDPDFAAIDLPILVLASRRDPVIDARALQRAAVHLSGVELHLLPGTGHELLREADQYRLPVLAHIDTFLDGLCNPGDMEISFSPRPSR